MNIYQIYGMKRSGNHAVLYWLINNLSVPGPKNFLDEANVSFYSEDVCFVNDITHNPVWTKDTIKKITKKLPKNLLLSYEDCSINTSLISQAHTPIVIIRNLENVVASRSASNRAGDKNILYKPVDDEFFKVWESHAMSNCFKIHYDQWLVDQVYRRSVLKHLSIHTPNMIDCPESVSVCGGGSSFVGQKLDESANLLNRHKQVELPEEIKIKIMHYARRNPMFSCGHLQ